MTKQEIVRRLIDEGFGLDDKQEYVVMRSTHNSLVLVLVEQLAEFCEKLH